ncbi:STAS domain-containing protein [Shewanella sp. AS1]|uniref:STAS domain-containing protein n=1 Tax=Shewanella sp. AS1 TaxID=2907626 RepID=UPI001F44F718|nr:STAS domain-containing protein [Shewanella sp. AS1]MCE9679972.1 STAS domain-containing protein [Shewanella sp. AS1]
MSAPQQSLLQFNVEQTQCYLSGHLSQQAVVELWPNVDNLLDNKVESLDLGGIESSDSAGVALLLHLMALKRRTGVTLMMQGAPSQLQKLIDLYDLQDFFAEEAKKG